MALVSKSILKTATTVGSALTADGIKNTVIGLGGLSFGTMISSAGGVAVGAPVAVASGALAVAGAVESAYGATVLLSSARNMGSDMQKLGDAMSSPEGAGNFNFTNTAANHMEEAGRAVPVQTLKDAISSGKMLPDPQGTSANMFYTTMTKNGKLYNLEVLYDKGTNTIMHFQYTPKAIGPLPAIPK